jgi:hypothetical protein
VVGLNAANNALEYKNITGTTGQTTITHSAGDIKVGLDSSITGNLLKRWTPLTMTTDFNAIAPSSTTITLKNDYTEIIKPGHPVRVLDIYGVPFGNGSRYVNNYSTITGLDASGLLDSRGRLWFETVVDSPGYVLKIYNRESKAASSLVAHTLRYTDLVTPYKAIIADNSSGLVGGVTILSLGAESWMVEFYKWGIVHSITWGGSTGTLTWDGPALTTGGGYLYGFWYGIPELAHVFTGSLWSSFEFDYYPHMEFHVRNTSGPMRVCKTHLDNYSDAMHVYVSDGSNNICAIDTSVSDESSTVDPLTYGIDFGDEFVTVMNETPNSNDIFNTDFSHVAVFE